MKRILAPVALLLAVLAPLAVIAQDHHIKATLVPVGGSAVDGFVQLEQLPHGGTNVHVIAKGLKPGTLYASFYYESNNCDAAHDLLGTFTANAGGVGEVHGKIDDDLDEVGSVSVRLGPGYGTLLACATVH